MKDIVKPQQRSEMKDESMWKTKRETARDYDALADTYETLYGEEQEAKIKSALESVRLGESDIVLDVGCGTGLLFHHIEEHVGFIVGLDISRRHIERALHKSRGSTNIYLVRGDADQMPFVDEVFDRIFAVTILQNMPDASLTVDELTRVAKAKALFIVTGLKKSFSKHQFLALLQRAGLHVLRVKGNGHSPEFVVACRKKNGYK